MNKTVIVMKKTWKKNIFSVPFMVMVLLPIVIITGLIAIMPKISNTDKDIVVINKLPSDISKDAFESNDKIIFTFKNTDKTTLSKEIQEKKISAYLEIERNINEVNATLYSDNKMYSDKIEPTVSKMLNNIQSRLNISLSNINSKQVEILSKTPVLNIVNKDSSHEAKSIMTIILLVSLFMIILIYASNISQEIAVEKGTKMIEIILSSIDSGKYFLGKILGILLTILTQIILYIVLFIPIVIFIKNSEYYKNIFDKFEMFKDISYESIIYQSIFLVLGVILYTIFSAVCGVFANRVEDASKVSFPIGILTMVAFMSSYFISIINPNSIIIKVLSYIPFMSSFSMPIRILYSSVSIAEIIVSIIILFISLFYCYHLALKIYKKRVFSTF